MHSFMDAKLMAKLLRRGLAERDIDLGHSECLELVARQFGVANWNILSARMEAFALATAPLPMPEGWVNGSARDGFFRMGLDPEHAGCAIIASTPMADHAPQSPFGTMSQSISAETYRGGGIRLSCDLSSDHIDGPAQSGYASTASAAPCCASATSSTSRTCLSLARGIGPDSPLR